MNEAQKNAIREADNYLKAAGLATYSALTQRPEAQAGEREAHIRKILAGIDSTENDSRDGWWETSEGAEFGATKLAELIAHLLDLPTQPEAQATPEPVGEAPIWNSIQIASWIGSQLMHEPAMFERAAVCKFVRSLGRHTTLLKHSPKDHASAPGVPEGFALVPMTKAQVDQVCKLALVSTPRSVEAWIESGIRFAEEHHAATLAAAQAKGGADHE